MQVFAFIDPAAAGMAGAGALIVTAALAATGLAVWGLGRLLPPSRLEAMASALNRADDRVASHVARLVGLTLHRTLLRRLVFALIFTLLAAGTLIAPLPGAAAAAGFAALLAFALVRHGLRERAERRRSRDSDHPLPDRVDVGPECLTAPLLAAFFVTAALIRAAGPAESIPQALTGLLSGALPGWLMASLAATAALIALAGFALVSVEIWRAASGRSHRDVDTALASEERSAVIEATERLEARALKNRRGAQQRLVQIAGATRKDARLTGIEYRSRAAHALQRTAEAFEDHGLALAAAHAFQDMCERIDRETNPVSWAEARMALADSIALSARLTGDASWLLEAAEALEAAAGVFTEDSAPDRWAEIQDRLGAVHGLAADRDPGARADAIAALRAGLSLRKRGGLASDRAATQEALSRILLDDGLATRNDGPIREAVALARDAEEIRARAGEPESWTRVRLLLSRARFELGRAIGDAGRITDAEAELGHTLKTLPRAKRPLQWAEAWHLRGTVLRALAGRTGEAAHLEQAEAAFRRALEVRTRETGADEWSETVRQLAETRKALGEHRREAALLARAAEGFETVLGMRGAAMGPAERARLLFNLGLTLSSQGRISEDARLLEAAGSALEDALKEAEAGPGGPERSAILHALGMACQARGRLTSDPLTLDHALHAFAQALQERSAEARPGAHAASQARLAETWLALYPIRKDKGLLERAFDAFEAAHQAFEAAGERDHSARMVEQMRRIRAVNRAPTRANADSEAPVTFGQAARRAS